MSDVTLTLDDFVFTGFEVPDEIGFGGGQALSVKKLIGGMRIIDAMGADDKALEWTGRHRGPDALSRAFLLDAKRRSGQQVTLTFGQFSFQVVVANYLPVYQRDNEIPYSITCEVLTQASNAAAPTVGVDQMVTGDMGSISSLSDDIMSVAQDVQGALALVNSVIQTPGAVIGDLVSDLSDAVGLIPSFASAARASLSGVFSAIGTLQGALTNCIAAAEIDLGSTDAPGGVDAGLSGPQLVAVLNAQTSATAQSSSLQSMASYVGRISTNLNALGASGAKTLMAGADLYFAAQQAYGDATAWVDIARVNGVTDPEIVGIQSILVPPTPSNADGVLQEVLDASPGAVTVIDTSVSGSGSEAPGTLDFSDPDNSGLLPGL